MPRVVFTGNLQRHTTCPPCTVVGRTVRESLDAAFALYPGAQGYVLDEHGALRAHMVVFVDGQAISDRRALRDPVGADSEVFVMQALSGG
ncbi:MAG: MoaD/ThiS family protein [Acidobacteriota bacterium]|nr:MoaD/ThiS family protein [Acidobacteriota bacterium]